MSCSLLPTPYSLLPSLCSLLPVLHTYIDSIQAAMKQVLKTS